MMSKSMNACAVLFADMVFFIMANVCEMTLHGAILNISTCQRQSQKSCPMLPSFPYMKSLHVNINLRVADFQLRLHPVLMWVFLFHPFIHVAASSERNNQPKQSGLPATSNCSVNDNNFRWRPVHLALVALDFSGVCLLNSDPFAKVSFFPSQASWRICTHQQPWQQSLYLRQTQNISLASCQTSSNKVFPIPTLIPLNMYALILIA